MHPLGGQFGDSQDGRHPMAGREGALETLRQTLVGTRGASGAMFAPLSAPAPALGEASGARLAPTHLTFNCTAPGSTRSAAGSRPGCSPSISISTRSAPTGSAITSRPRVERTLGQSIDFPE